MCSVQSAYAEEDRLLARGLWPSMSPSLSSQPTSVTSSATPGQCRQWNDNFFVSVEVLINSQTRKRVISKAVARCYAVTTDMSARSPTFTWVLVQALGLYRIQSRGM